MLAPLMNRIISPSQTGFLMGRAISVNGILTQELVHNLNRSNINGNVVFKLDMAKAFDRVALDYLCQIMRQLGVFEFWIDMVARQLVFH